MLNVPFVVVFLFLDGMFINSMESWASPQAQKPILKKGFSRATYLLLDLLAATTKTKITAAQETSNSCFKGDRLIDVSATSG